MNWEQKLENLYQSQSLIESEIVFTQEQIYLSSSEHYIQTTRVDIYKQEDVAKYTHIDTTTDLPVYFYAESPTLRKRYLETYHYQAIYREGELIGYERRNIDREITDIFVQINLKSIRID